MPNATITKKVAQLYRETPLTDFSSVKAETPLDSLNLNWRERDLPEHKRTKHVHRLHPYLGKFVPQLVEIFLRKYRPKLIYDPFVGSGTTLVEANVLGIDAIGTDISAFNVLLSQVKTAEYDIVQLDKDIQSALGQLAISKLSTQELHDSGIAENQYLKEWFSLRARRELLCYLRALEKCTYKDLLKVILSRSARSARLVTHFGLDFPKQPQIGPYHCYKHDRMCQPTDEAYKFLHRYSIDSLERVKEFSRLRTNAVVAVNHGDSRKVKLPHGIDMIFTSPPYIGLIDYHEQHKYAYELLGLQNNAAREIGTAREGRSCEAKQAYIKGINDVLVHTREHMTQDGLALIVVHDKYDLYQPKIVGFKEIGRVERHVNRRTGRRESAFYESILVWQKA